MLIRWLSQFILVATIALMLPAVGFAAEDASADLNAPDALRHVLEQQVGKRVKVKLISGQELDGKVQKVGAQAATLSELGGMDFFDATVRLDQVAAVLVKARGK
ncbi:MAG TPA: hypothetical protein VFS39_08745 [Nitrospira sp.]|nr:hypothetical protein [Nitrospira sp.]